MWDVALLKGDPGGDDDHGMRDIPRWRRHLQVEVDGAAIYRAMARAEREQTVAALYERLAVAESRHARIWAKKLRGAGAWRGFPRPSLTATVLITVAKRLGPDILGRSLAARETAERAAYEDQDDAISALLTDEERFHARLLGRITRAKLSGPGMARLGNALRAAVLGMNDGLVSNLSLVMGVAGAGGDTHAIVVAGLAGLLAGSLSMALGEYLSVQTSRELYERQLILERDNVEEAPREEIDEIALIYMSKGMDAEKARSVAAQLVGGSIGAHAERTHEDEDVADLGGSAWIAALTSFAMFACGAAVSLLPFAFLTGAAAQLAAIVLTGGALFANGSAITTITGRPALRAGLRQTAIGFAAATITYGLGRLLNVALG